MEATTFDALVYHCARHLQVLGIGLEQVEHFRRPENGFVLWVKNDQPLAEVVEVARGDVSSGDPANELRSPGFRREIAAVEKAVCVVRPTDVTRQPRETGLRSHPLHLMSIPSRSLLLGLNAPRRPDVRSARGLVSRPVPERRRLDGRKRRVTDACHRFWTSLSAVGDARPVSFAGRISRRGHTASSWVGPTSAARNQSTSSQASATGGG